MRRTDDRGFVLLTVLWTMVLLGTLAGLYLSESHDMLRISANRNAELRARQAALAGIASANNTLERLHRQSLPTETLRGRASREHWLRTWNNLDSIVAPLHRQCLQHACFEVRVRDLGTLLNVNVADEKDLERFFRALGAEQTEALIAAQSIADWIDADDDPRRFGAERNFYLLATEPYAPRNAAISDLSELRLIRGLHPALYERARPHLTVHGLGAINVNGAPPAVLRSLPGSAHAVLATSPRPGEQRRIVTDVDQLVRMLPDGPGAGGASEASGLRSRVTLEPRDLEVVSTARADGGSTIVTVWAIFRREADGVVLITRSQSSSP